MIHHSFKYHSLLSINRSVWFFLRFLSLSLCPFALSSLPSLPPLLPSPPHFHTPTHTPKTLTPPAGPQRTC